MLPEGRYHCSDVPPESLDGAGLVVIVLGPRLPSRKQTSDGYLITDACLAAVAYKRCGWRNEILQREDGIGGGLGLGEPALLIEPVEAVQRPGQNPVNSVVNS
jgi:hypothetical protein